MEKHLPLVGILNLVYRALLIIGGLVLAALAIGFRYLLELVSYSNHHHMDEVPEIVFVIAPIILGVISAIIIVISILGIIGAIGVLKKKEWGRILLLIVSFFNLLHVPLGTILGVYTIWALFNDETIKMFNPPVAQPVDKAKS
jgi:hypothetical protein